MKFLYKIGSYFYCLNFLSFVFAFLKSFLYLLFYLSLSPLISPCLSSFIGYEQCNQMARLYGQCLAILQRWKFAQIVKIAKLGSQNFAKYHISTLRNGQRFLNFTKRVKFWQIRSHWTSEEVILPLLRWLERSFLRSSKKLIHGRRHVQCDQMLE